MQASCRLLKVSEAGYYEWRNRPPSLRALRHTWLREQITAVHAASRGTYGARRIHAELTLGLGLTVGHNQIEAVMSRAGIKGLPGTRRPKSRHQTPTAGDLFNRLFAREQPNGVIAFVSGCVCRKSCGGAGFAHSVSCNGGLQG